MEVANILTIDGGGTAGFFSYGLLKQLWTKPVTIDLIVGVSIGAIVGALYATGKLADQHDDSVRNDIEALFQDRSSTSPWEEPIYKGATKREMLYRLFADMTLGEVEIDLAILTDRLLSTPVLFKSWDPRHCDLPLYQLLDATSAVPLFFPPVYIHGEAYIDGGTVSTSPISFGHQLGQLHFPQKTLNVLSVGTVVSPLREPPADPVPAKEMGLFNLLPLIPGKLLAQRSWLSNQTAREILGARFLRVEGVVDASFTDTSVATYCLERAREVWEANEEVVRVFLRR
jgi:predicted acylesterase/phospholipase RssA